MIKVIKNGIAVTMAEGRPIYEKLDIVIEDDTIKELVDNYEGPADMIEYANKKIIIPGLINGHSHHGMAMFKGINDNLTLDDWLNKKIWPIENSLTEEDIYRS